MVDGIVTEWCRDGWEDAFEIHVKTVTRRLPRRSNSDGAAHANVLARFQEFELGPHE